MVYILLLIGVPIFLGICLFGIKVDRTDFNNRFPPITDEEFMALCPAGTRPEIALKVRRIVSEQAGVEYERIYPSTRFINDL